MSRHSRSPAPEEMSSSETCGVDIDDRDGGSWRSGSPGARLTLFQVPRDRLPDGLVGHSKVSPDRGVAKPKLVENKDSRHDTPVGRC